MIDPAQAGSALLLGLSGAGHCVGMCGGIAGALNLGGARGTSITLYYHLGRIGSYTMLGAMLGLAAGSLDLVAWTMSLRYLAGALLIGMGLYIANLWRGMQVLERAGAHLWRPVQRLAANWLPARHWYHGLMLGMCWGLMPCGLIYSSLAWAATAQRPETSALMMLLFGLGTLPVMLAVSFGASGVQTALSRRGLRTGIGLLLVASGCWTLYAAASHSQHHQHLAQMQPEKHDHRQMTR